MHTRKLQSEMDIVLYSMNWQFAPIYLEGIVKISKFPDWFIDQGLQTLTLLNNAGVNWSWKG